MINTAYGIILTDNEINDIRNKITAYLREKAVEGYENSVFKQGKWWVAESRGRILNNIGLTNSEEEIRVFCGMENDRQVKVGMFRGVKSWCFRLTDEYDRKQ